MYCNKCGKELRDGDLFCSGCGAKVEPAEATEYTVPEKINIELGPETSTEEKKEKFRMDTINWDLEGYPKDSPRRSRDTGFDWSSVVEKPVETSETGLSEDYGSVDYHVTEEDLFGDMGDKSSSAGDTWQGGATVRVDSRRPGFRNTLASDDPDFKVGASIFSSSRGFDEEEEVQVNSADFVPPLNRGGNIFYTGSELKKRDIEDAVTPTHHERIIPDDDTSAFLADSVDIADAIQPIDPPKEYEEDSYEKFEEEYLPKEREFDDYDDYDDEEREGSFTKRLFAGVSNVFSKLDILSEDDEEIESVEEIIPSSEEPQEASVEFDASSEAYEARVQENAEARTSRIKSPIRFKSPKRGDVDRTTPIEDFERDIREASQAGSSIATPKYRSSTDKFYTFNQKSDEFKALLDEEYERLRQRIQEESGGSENSALERVYQKGAEARAKRAAEEEARLAAEAEARAKAEEEARIKAEEEAKLAAEAEAKAKAEEEARLAAEAEANAKAEEEARIKAEEEAKLAAEAEAKAKAEEEARLAAEAEAKAKAEEEARLAAEAEAKAKEEEAMLAAEAEEEATPEIETLAEVEEKAEPEAEVPEIEEVVEIAEDTDVDDFERRLAELTAQMESIQGGSSEVRLSPAMPTADAAVAREIKEASDETQAQEDSPIEIKTIDPDEEEDTLGPAANRNTVIIDRNEAKEALKEEERRLRYGDIFSNDEEEEEEEETGGRAKLVILDILIAILLVCVILTAIMVFGENTAIGQKLHSLIGLTTQQQAAEEGEEATDETVPTDAGTEEAAEEPEISPVATAIVQQAVRNQNIGEIAEDTALLFDGDKDYGIEGVQFASIFTDGDWYTDGSGKNVTYMSELVGAVIEYNSKLVDKYNKGSDEVLALVNPESQLYADLQTIESEEGSMEMTKLQIGEVRQDGTNFYILTRVAENLSSEENPVVRTELVRIDTSSNSAVIEEVVPVQ